LLFAAKLRQTLGALPEGLSERAWRKLPPGSLSSERRGRLEREQLDGLVDPSSTQVHAAEKLGDGEAFLGCLER
jgi:hypothetical protein